MLIVATNALGIGLTVTAAQDAHADVPSISQMDHPPVDPEPDHGYPPPAY